jgi:hypothetical protein
MKFAGQQTTNKVKLEANSTAQTEFTFKPQKAGVEPVEFSAKTIPGEASDKNNLVTRNLKVLQDKINILLVTSNPSWDFQYVRNALSRSKWAKLQDVIMDGGQLSIPPDKILQQNVIALFRVTPSMLNASRSTPYIGR